MTADKIKTILDLHKKWLSNEEGGKKANLSRADLSGADLRWANFDYSSGIPLSCGGSKFTVSLKLIYQYFAHFCTLKVDASEQQEFEEILEKIRPYALKSHRAGDLGLLKGENTPCSEKT